MELSNENQAIRSARGFEARLMATVANITHYNDHSKDMQ